MLPKRTFLFIAASTLLTLLAVSWNGLYQECDQRANVQEYKAPPLQRDNHAEPIQMPTFVEPEFPVQRHEIVFDQVIISMRNSPVIV